MKPVRVLGYRLPCPGRVVLIATGAGFGRCNWASHGGEGRRGPSRHREHPRSCAQTPYARPCECAVCSWRACETSRGRRGAASQRAQIFAEKSSSQRASRRRAEFQLDLELRWRTRQERSSSRREGKPPTAAPMPSPDARERPPLPRLHCASGGSWVAQPARSLLWGGPLLRRKRVCSLCTS